MRFIVRLDAGDLAVARVICFALMCASEKFSTRGS
jgi:hypothetical protein